MTKEEIYDRLYKAASLIPPGKVLTYGQLAFLAGIPRGARLAGRAMANCREDFVPCHRVVNARGCCAPGFIEQRELLLAEGVAILPDGRVDLKNHLWKPAEMMKNMLQEDETVILTKE